MLRRSITKLTKRHLPASVKTFLHKQATQVEVIRAQPGSWTGAHLAFRHPEPSEVLDRIEQRARATESMGSQPLWAGFEQAGGTRTSEDVRTNAAIGRFFTFVTTQRRPELIVEFGTAFGLSGMYWLAGLEANGQGHMLTFEPNDVWARIAKDNLSAISDRFTLTVGTFEDHLDAVRAPIDIGFIDAIHTSAFVRPQLALVEERSSPGALIFLDDIGFSDDMNAMWKELAADPKYAASATIGNVGLLELAGRA